VLALAGSPGGADILEVRFFSHSTF
jgi:hypothetical protein